MAADFTYGRWECNHIESKNKGCIITADGKYVATVQKDGDARLISAAPDMYELLYEAMQDLRQYETKLSYKKTMWELIEEELNRIDGKEINP